MSRGNNLVVICRITKDAREDEMEDNMGQVNTMIGNLRNMAVDMGSELENQNNQVDRINRKVTFAQRTNKQRIIEFTNHIFHFYCFLLPTNSNSNRANRMKLE